LSEHNLALSREDHPLTQFTMGDKDNISRLNQFIAWQDGRQPWYQPDLAAYRDDLLADGLQLSSVGAYVSTVRGAYKKLLVSNHVRDRLYQLTDPALSVADRRAFVEELLDRLRNAVDPLAAPVKLTKVQDEEDQKHLRMTTEQAEALLNMPDIRTMRGLRDAAIISMLLCTGVREDELCALDVDDLRQSLGGEMALRVRHGKGDKQRLIPYGQLSWCLMLVDAWMGRARISSGAVFRGLAWKGALREGRIQKRSVHRLLIDYPLIIHGRTVQVRPHDCRRTYARLMYEAGMEIVAIQQNLGHEDVKTTLRYIGALDASARRAKGVLQYNVKQLQML
jgi:site-specific recombinase XerC